MKTTMKQSILVAIVAMACSTMMASPRMHRRLAHPAMPPRHAPITVVVRNNIIVMDQSQRLHMAVGYLKDHDHITAGKYAQLTRLDKAQAQAELNFFASRRDNPIMAIQRGKKTVYVLR